jgi:hypothetical protein
MASRVARENTPGRCLSYRNARANCVTDLTICLAQRSMKGHEFKQLLSIR